jgi:hypothetical protein
MGSFSQLRQQFWGEWRRASCDAPARAEVNQDKRRFGAGPIANCSTSSITAERCSGDSLLNAFNRRTVSTVSFDGLPSFSRNSTIDGRRFILHLRLGIAQHAMCAVIAGLKSGHIADVSAGSDSEVEIMPRNNPHGKPRQRSIPWILTGRQCCP